MEMITVDSICKFCGQHKMVEVPEFFTQEEIVNEASKECYCKDGQAFKEELELKAMIEQQKTSAKGDTFRLFNSDYPAIEKVFNDAIDSLVNHDFKKMTITTDDGVTASIKWKDGIEVERVNKDVQRSKTKIYEIHNA